jgi:hypothetical protein
MATVLQSCARSLSVEVLKCRRTLVFWLAAGAPFFTTFLVFNIFCFNGSALVKAGTNPWPPFLDMLGTMWGFFLLSMYVTMQSSLLLSIEHQANTWKYVYSLAVPRWTVYCGKLLLTVLLVGLAVLLLYAFTETAALGLSLLRPELGFDAYSAGPVAAKSYTKLLLSGMGVVGIQHYLSFRYGNFIVPLAFGLAMSIASVLPLPRQPLRYLPYALPLSAVADLKYEGRHFPLFDGKVYLSLAVFGAAGLLGYALVRRRDVA